MRNFFRTVLIILSFAASAHAAQQQQQQNDIPSGSPEAQSVQTPEREAKGPMLSCFTTQDGITSGRGLVTQQFQIQVSAERIPNVPVIEKCAAYILYGTSIANLISIEHGGCSYKLPEGMDVDYMSCPR